jgi:5'-deoxynucleotidase YfbR-like HD superfamily hydrolase
MLEITDDRAKQNNEVLTDDIIKEFKEFIKQQYSTQFVAEKKERQELKAAFESSIQENYPKMIHAITDLQKLVQAQLVPVTAYIKFLKNSNNYNYLRETKSFNEEEYSRLEELMPILGNFDKQLKSSYQNLKDANAS